MNRKGLLLGVLGWVASAFAVAPVAEAADANTSIHTFKAPLYWSVYEYCWDKERAGETHIDISVDEWDRIIEWVSNDLKPSGYNMICTDGFISMDAKDGSGYMTHYGSISLKDLVAKCAAKGLEVGVYDNPLWIHGWEGINVQGVEGVTLGMLRWDGSSQVLNPEAADKWFTWVDVTKRGAREYIDGFFKHYSDMGVKYIRMDFMSWYEDGKDRNLGTVSRGYGRDSYTLALRYIAESAKKYGVFTSLVMPHLYNDAELEAECGNMVRIVCDTGDGGWWHVSIQDRGKSYSTWPTCMNMFDGFTYWNHLAGKGKVILDGDFIRLNKLYSDNERQSTISLQLMAGGPITVADQYTTMGDNLKFYTNQEMLALNEDRFVGRPLSDQLGDRNNEIWYGTMSNGDMVVALFNRDEEPRSYNLPLSTFGIEGERVARDLWRHEDEGKLSELDYTIPGHGCKVLRLSEVSAPVVNVDYIWLVGEGSLAGWNDTRSIAIGSDPENPRVFKGTVYLNANKDFKFMTAPAWGSTEYGAQPGAAIVNGSVALASGKNDEGYSKFQVVEPGNYLVTINTETLSATFVKSGYQGSQIAYSALGIVGDATPNGWNLDKVTPLFQNPETPYIYSVKNLRMTPGEFKVNLIPNRSWDADCFATMDPANPSKMVVGGADNKWRITVAGNYNVEVNTRDNTLRFADANLWTGVGEVDVEEIEAEYYTLTGVRVLNPDKGIYIRKKGNKIEKIAL